MTDLKVLDKEAWNHERLKQGMAIRMMTGKALAEALGVKPRKVYAWMGGETPPEDVQTRIMEVLSFPRNFFCRPGRVPPRDPRFPPDMYVPLPDVPPPTRERCVEMMQFVNDRDIPALMAFLEEIADYGDGIINFTARANQEKP